MQLANLTNWMYAILLIHLIYLECRNQCGQEVQLVHVSEKWRGADVLRVITIQVSCKGTRELDLKPLLKGQRMFQ